MSQVNDPFADEAQEIIDITEKIGIYRNSGPMTSECKFEDWVRVDPENNFWMHKEHLHAAGK